MKMTKNKVYLSIYDDIKEIYKMYPSGGVLHDVLDDYNTDDDSILFCISEIQRNYKAYYDKKSNRPIEHEKRLFLNCATKLLSVKSEQVREDIISLAQKDIYAEMSASEEFDFEVSTKGV